MKTRTRLLAAVLLPTFAIAAPAPAPAPAAAPVPAGASWRVIEPPTPATGPAVLDVPTASLAKIADAKRQKTRSAPAPEIEVVAVDAKGAPAAGVAVLVGLKGAKRDAKALRLAGATDANGRFVLKPQGSTPLVKVSVDLAWDDGFKIMGIDLEAESGKWSVKASPYKDPLTKEDHGSCKNLLAFERLAARPDRVPTFRLRASLPETLLACASVNYGADRKSDQAARLHEIGSRDINQGDKNMFSEDDEAKLGVEAATKFDSELEILEDAAIRGYVQGLMERVVAASDDPSMPVKVRVVHTDDINAFCTMGGNIYVFTGLIKAAQNESMLAGVLAHEFAHAVAHHVTEGATRQMKTQVGAQLGAALAAAALGLGTTSTDVLVRGSSTAAGILGLKYDRRFEAEADLLGEQYLWKAGWDPESIARFFELLDARGATASIPGWLSTHPTHENRIRNGIAWARTFLPAKERYLVDTAAFQDCKRRVAALPPPKKAPEPAPAPAPAPAP